MTAKRPQPDEYVYLCPVCKMGIWGNIPESDHYGKLFESQAEADLCCEDMGYTPGTPNGAALPEQTQEQKYGEWMDRLGNGRGMFQTPLPARYRKYHL